MIKIKYQLEVTVDRKKQPLKKISEIGRFKITNKNRKLQLEFFLTNKSNWLEKKILTSSNVTEQEDKCLGVS